MATTVTRPNPHPHILVFPYPAQGHMLALLDLTHQLALRGLTITILVTPKNLPFLSLLLSSHPSITPLVFPFPSHLLIPPGVEHVKDLGNSGNLPIMVALGKLHDPLVEWFDSHSEPPVAIVSDFFLGWTQCLAIRLQIPRLTFYSSGAFVVTSLSEIEFGNLPGSPVFKQEHLPSLFKLYKPSDPDLEMIKDGHVANTKSWGCFINSFEDLEAEYVHVGPLSSVSEMNDQVLTWLDRCPDGSVVYVCFGSQKLLRKEQIEALANGLEKSGTRFIWVVKSGTTQQQVEGFGVVPYGFEQRTAGQVGGFLSLWVVLKSQIKRGVEKWNSVLEGIVAGVMILAWPMKADQFLNARLLVDNIGVAVRVCEGADSVPDSDELGRAIAEVMTEGGGMKANAKDLKEKALAAVSHEGSSMKDLDRFVEELGQLGG
ncbi:hypothetical protein ES288_A04G192800v1 [Gossypium darwinii]|uniref:UDP-glycosyltransferases domain-containing protein n=1 Tax=Gossypium darwinii TaxID=34276 RepID=A0A5D2H016_GOSDA|nr:hypothetical protein ES288_A04G192800v1 [Gossypium darwinii]